jgi:mRNA-degrading endonuclease toxin of MazEF toxin-antitoxin module
MTALRRSTKPGGWYPRRGEVCLADLDKERPVIVISSDVLNAHSLDVCILPITTVQHRAFSLRPQLKAGEGGLNHDSWVKCDQPTTMEKQDIIYPPLGALSSAAIQKIEAALKAALELP